MASSRRPGVVKMHALLGILVFVVGVGQLALCAPPVEPTTRGGKLHDGDNDADNYPYSHLLPFQVSAMTRASDGQYLAHVAIGKPIRRFSVSVSTSSSLLIVACGTCGTHKNTYDMSASVSRVNQRNFPFSEDIIGEFNNMYNLLGEKILDDVCVGESCIPDANGAMLEFGCISSSCPKEFAESTPDGILGLSVDRPGESMLYSLIKAKKMKHRLFSFCLGMDKGAVAIGGVMPQAVRTSTTQFGRMDASRSWSYLLHVRSIGIGMNDRITTDVGVPLLTSVANSFVPLDVLHLLRAQLWKHCAVHMLTKNSLCGVVEPSPEPNRSEHLICLRQAPGVSVQEFMSKLPNITLWVEGFQHQPPPMTNGTGLSQLLIRPEHYMFYADANYPTHWCSSIMRGHSHRMYIGSDVMRGHEWVFDLDRNQVAWTPAQCEKVYSAASAPPSPEPPAHLATMSPTTVEEGAGTAECCVEAGCVEAPVDASLVKNNIITKYSSTLEFTPTEEHPDVRCLRLRSGMSLVVENPKENVRVSICPNSGTPASHCVFDAGCGRVVVAAQRALVGTLRFIRGIWVWEDAHVSVNGAIAIRSTEQWREESSSVLSGGVLQTTADGSTPQHVMLTFDELGYLSISGALVLDANTDISCKGEDPGIILSGEGQDSPARLQVRHAPAAHIGCVLALKENSVLELEAWHSRTKWTHLSPVVVVDELRGRYDEKGQKRGYIHFKLHLDLLTGRASDETVTPELTARVLNLLNDASSFRRGHVEVSLDANLVPADFVVDPKTALPTSLADRSMVVLLATKELHNLYKLDGRLWCSGARVRYHQGRTNLYLPFNPACLLECARLGSENKYPQIPNVCEDDPVWRQHAALKTYRSSPHLRAVIKALEPLGKDPLAPPSSPVPTASSVPAGSRIATVVVPLAIVGLAVLGGLVGAAYRRPRAAGRMLAVPRRTVAALLGGSRQTSLDGGEGDFEGESEMIREMTAPTTSRVPPAPAPAPESLGYELQES